MIAKYRNTEKWTAIGFLNTAGAHHWTYSNKPTWRKVYRLNPTKQDKEVFLEDAQLLASQVLTEWSD